MILARINNHTYVSFEHVCFHCPEINPDCKRAIDGFIITQVRLKSRIFADQLQAMQCGHETVQKSQRSTSNEYYSVNRQQSHTSKPRGIGNSTRAKKEHMRNSSTIQFLLQTSIMFLKSEQTFGTGSHPALKSTPSTTSAGIGALVIVPVVSSGVGITNLCILALALVLQVLAQVSILVLVLILIIVLVLVHLLELALVLVLGLRQS
jgi:hypothetical protein